MDVKKMNRRFPLKVWLTSVLFAPLLMIILFAIRSGQVWDEGFIAFYIMGLVAGFFLSIPAFFIFRFVYRKWFSKCTGISLRWRLLAVSFCVLSLTFALANWISGIDIGLDAWYSFAAMMISIAVMTFVFKMEKDLQG